MNEELGYVLETIRFKTSIYRDKNKRNLSFNNDDYYSNILNEYITDLQQENKILKENAENNDKVVDKVNWENMLLKKENKILKDKLSKIETLIINHNCDTGDIYYKYNSKFLKSELKQRILEILEDKEVQE